MNGQMSPNLQPIMEEGATNNNKKKKKGKNEESKKDSDEEEEQKEEKKKIQRMFPFERLVEKKRKSKLK